MATQPLSGDLAFKLDSGPHFHKTTYSIKEAFQSRVSGGRWGQEVLKGNTVRKNTSYARSLYNGLTPKERIQEVVTHALVRIRLPLVASDLRVVVGALKNLI